MIMEIINELTSKCVLSRKNPKSNEMKWFILGSFIASNIHAALFFANCDILGVKIIRIDPLEPNIWLCHVCYAVLQLFF